ncbi:MAG TPA: hypothetical protein VFX02_10630 [Gammaproteobacteria bacterium]|nr:hypothetical protein [Gammaproteobacteria bacterium]
MKILKIIPFLLSTSAFAFDKHEDAWGKAEGKGVCEAMVTEGFDNEILVSCDCGSGFVDEISITLKKPLSKDFNVLMTFDNLKPISVPTRDGNIVADTRKGKANFKKVLGLFRKHKSVKVEFPNGRHATFTLKGSSSALKACP